MRKAARKDILKINEFFTNHLINIQMKKHNPLDYEYKEGDSYCPDDPDQPVILTKANAEELNSKYRDYINTHKDINPFNTQNELKWIGRAVLISRKTDSASYLHDLGESLETLRQATANKNLIIMGDWPMPWLSQENEYRPVKESLDWFKTQIDMDFTGGFLLNGNEIIEFISRLFWLIRCNASLPEFMMTYENLDTVFSICQYGALHLESYDIEELKFILKFFEKFGFLQIEECNDPVMFDDFKGRKIIISNFK